MKKQKSVRLLQRSWAKSRRNSLKKIRRLPMRKIQIVLCI
ncbi:hypothetical protein L914_02805 [Phytophthora nicotianae]|uniref:Uncharacterized protein n=1 Tax=Phytophthora nicotianae TaxID=4792 RepID=W2P1F8_PHYNI|nr:hypothetical protein L914_02805 [Phytophthora nicotianae]